MMYICILKSSLNFYDSGFEIDVSFPEIFIILLEKYEMLMCGNKLSTVKKKKFIVKLVNLVTVYFHFSEALNYAFDVLTPYQRH